MSSVTEQQQALRPRGGLSPRKKQRISRGIQYAVLVIVVVVLAAIADWPAISQSFLNMDVAREGLPELFTVALKNTVIYTITGYAFGFVLGLVLALMRLSSVGPYRWIAATYIEIFRGLPALVIFLMIINLPLAFPGFRLPGDVYGQAALGLGLVSAAYMAETFRAGLQAVPKGQMEAARSLGMPYMRAMVSIIIPQAVRIVIPPLTNELVLLFKDSSLVLFLGVTASQAELAKFGNDEAATFANPTPIFVAGVTYLLITVPLGYLARRLEARQGGGR
ncbi:amino acid ABC transporter permease [Thermobispora bispora]|uniref:Polar amino acid ABC transporter, inner membrane subunit n=1 Tax=Thermobispora bispora (strain ATCC 19993 / DSM 43833 / CBS 139.67 / JCM 10125 / KCTC 9307 / NBRC 14880 / R51) TaxID=469371 RepID=D6Y3N0_THEBD|nr:amino acid ABC transporter permease [Thermobispora bispora]ADG87059.1 polar amino acid ABC transporter, inner membrane subunit [Thermobispora bispora DSM 43833]